MNEYLEYLKNPFIAGAVAGLAIALFAYGDKYINERDFENQYFFRLFLGVFALVAGLLYFVGSESKKQSGGGSIDRNIKTVVDKTGLEVYTDLPGF